MKIVVQTQLLMPEICILALQPCPIKDLDRGSIHIKSPLLPTKTNSIRNKLTTYKMLRRKPTVITLTTEDVAIYEDARAREALAREQAAHQAQVTPQKINQNRDPNDELRPLPGDRARGAQVKTREERLGLGGSSRT
jgi:hypothetical protein